MNRLLALTLGVALAGVGTAALATRNSSGTYSLPSGNPVVGGTVISRDWANNTLGDIGQSLTDSLDRNGKGPMLAPLRVQNGSNAAPSLSFNNDQDTGLYLVGDANPAVTVAGAKRQEWTSTGTAVSGTLSVTGASTFTGAAAFDGGLTGFTRSSMYAVGQQVSASCGTFTTASGPFVDATNLSVTITTTGRPVLLMLQSEGTAPTTGAFMTGPAGAILRFQRDAAVVGDYDINSRSAAPAAILDTGASAGTHTYKIRVSSALSQNTSLFYYVLVAYEL
jgi:hypothetical protein